jgi:16S rRNA (guanine527-N7)-methyltransferase
MLKLNTMEIKSDNVSRETLDLIGGAKRHNKSRLQEYAALLLQMNKNVNLVSRDMLLSDIEQHVYHCLWVCASRLWENNAEIVDAGSGGGLPGIALGIVFPEVRIICIDIVEKKALAMKHIIRQLGLKNVTAEHFDIEFFEPENADMCLVSKHAFKIHDILDKTARHKITKLILLKGSDFVHELAMVKYPIKISSIRIDEYEADPFYEGKCVITIERQ